MNCSQILELAAAHALGTLSPAEAARLEAIAASDPDVRAELDSFLDVARLLTQSVAPVAAPEGVRARVLARIRQTPQVDRRAPGLQPGEKPVQGFRFVRPSAGPWKEGPVPGARLQVLSADLRRNYLMLCIELDPGTRYPDHTHGGSEQLYVLSGDLMTGGRLMVAGDFLHCDAGSRHEAVMSPSGCQALLITSVTSAMGEFVKGMIKRTVGP